MIPYIIDTHSHLFLEEFDADREEAIQRARENRVGRLYLPNIDCASLPHVEKMARQYPNYCYPMIGLHPTSVSETYEEELQRLYLHLQSSRENEAGQDSYSGKDVPVRYVGIGEVGLDFYWDDTFHTEQLDAFLRQIRWAKEYRLPLVVHSRNAFRETYETVSNEAGEELKGIFHCFGGTAEEARKLLSIPGFYLGIGGIITYKKSTLPQVLLEEVPLDRIVLETDCPYLAPVPYRGKRNESSYIIHTAERIAEIYNVSLSVVFQVTTDNAERIFSKNIRKPL